jgi:transcriptional regulator with XRE-family HTH domain
LLNARKQAGLTQEELAGRIGAGKGKKYFCMTEIFRKKVAYM